MRGDPKGPWDYLLEGEPLVVQASPIRFSVVGAHLDQCTSWCCCESLRSSSVNFFEVSMRLPIS